MGLAPIVLLFHSRRLCNYLRERSLVIVHNRDYSVRLDSQMENDFMNAPLAPLETDRPFMLGVAGRLPELTERDLELMREASVGWLRFGDFKFDARAFMEGRPQGAEFEAAKERARNLRAAGFQIMGLTPGPRDLKDAIGVQGSAEYLRNYAKINAFYARELGEIVEWWQMANELDIWIFRETLSMEQSVEFLKTGIRAMKEAAPELKVGINVTLFPSLPGEVDGNTDAHEGIALAQGIYGDEDLPVDYAGFDSYPGTWRNGGPESWHEYLDGFHQLTGKPIIVQEFGYSSAGDIMTKAESDSGLYPCEAKKWRFSWNGAHSEKVQADFIRESFRIFAEKPFVIGATYYNWRDSQDCWQCRDAACPAETAWGLLDRDGHPKAGYFSYKESAAEIFGQRLLCSVG